jgi:P4 family phage/plasmid primase-like protien
MNNGEESMTAAQILDERYKEAREPRHVSRAKPRTVTEGVKAQVKKVGGANPTMRLAQALEQMLGKPVKCKGKGEDREWYFYSSGKWALNPDAPECYETLALEVQGRDNRNVRRADELLKTVHYRNRFKEGEKFWGAIRWEPGAISYFINCPTKVLEIDITTGRLIGTLDSSPDYMFTESLAVDYNSSAVCPLFDRTLTEVLEEQADIDLVLNWSTLTLIPHSKHECCLMCIGAGGNGKSIVMEAIANPIGASHVSRVTLNQICGNNRKHVFRMERKLLNLSTETEIKRIAENTVFKTIVSGEQFTTDKIFEHGFEMQTNCKLCFLLNNMPEFEGGSNAEPRRLEFAHFPKTFEGEAKNLDLKDQLKDEAPGILRKLMERIPQVIRMKTLGIAGKASQEAKERFKITNNLPKAFVDQCLLLEQPLSSFVVRDDLWKCYRRFAHEYNTNSGFRDEAFKRMYVYRPKLRSLEKRKVVNGEQRYVIQSAAFTDKGKELMEGL